MTNYISIITWISKNRLCNRINEIYEIDGYNNVSFMNCVRYLSTAFKVASKTSDPEIRHVDGKCHKRMSFNNMAKPLIF